MRRAILMEPGTVTKICRECSLDLPLDSFYKHKEMADGHLNKCKECVKKRVRSHRERNPESISKYEATRAKLPKRKELSNAISKKRRHEVDGYGKSHNAVTRAVRNGTLTRGDVCQVCGTHSKTEGHHNDYHKSLRVIWLCVSCHRLYHNSKSDKAERVRIVVDSLFAIRDAIHD